MPNRPPRWLVRPLTSGSAFTFGSGICTVTFTCDGAARAAAGDSFYMATSANGIILWFAPPDGGYQPTWPLVSVGAT